LMNIKVNNVAGTWELNNIISLLPKIRYGQIRRNPSIKRTYNPTSFVNPSIA